MAETKSRVREYGALIWTAILTGVGMLNGYSFDKAFSGALLIVLAYLVLTLLERVDNTVQRLEARITQMQEQMQEQMERKPWQPPDLDNL